MIQIIPKYFEESEDFQKKKPFIKIEIVNEIKQYLFYNPSSFLSIFDIKNKFGHDLSLLPNEFEYLQTDNNLFCYLQDGYKWCFTMNSNKILYRCKEKMLQHIFHSTQSIRINKTNCVNYKREIMDLYRLIIFGSVYGKDCSTPFDKYFAVRKRTTRMFLIPLITNAHVQTNIDKTTGKKIQIIVFNEETQELYPKYANQNIQKRIKRGEAVVLVDEKAGTYDINRVNNSINIQKKSKRGDTSVIHEDGKSRVNNTLNFKKSKAVSSLSEGYTYKKDSNIYSHDIKINEIPLCMNRTYDKDVSFSVFRVGASQQMRKFWYELSENKN